MSSASQTKTFFHVFVIGAASNSSSPGQLPDVKNLISFSDDHSDLQCYWYFIDPSHTDNKKDSEQFAEYTAHNIPFTVVDGGDHKNFSVETFFAGYKVLPSDNALFVDYSGQFECEYDMSMRLGQRFLYSVPGCYGIQLDMNKTFRDATELVKYNIFSDDPVPEDMTYKNRMGVKRDIDKLIVFVRMLPLIASDPDPPKWLLDQYPVIGDTRENWYLYRTETEDKLNDWFLTNEIDIYVHDSRTWSGLARKILSL